MSDPERRILFSVCGRLTDAEIKTLVALIDQLGQMGISCKVWTDNVDPRIAEHSVAQFLNRPSFFRRTMDRITPGKELSSQEASKWTERIEKDPPDWLQLRCPNMTTEVVMESLYSLTNQIHREFRPTNFFAWNPHYYYFGIPARLLNRWGVKTGSLERGPVLDTLSFDTGVLADSRLVNVPANDFRECPPARQSLLSRIGAVWDSNSVEPGVTTTETSILILPTSDFQSGLVPAGTEEAQSILPFHNGFADLIGHIKSMNLGTVSIKAHPHCLQEWNPGNQFSENIVDGDPIELISRADIVVANGTKLEFAAATLKKPLVLPGFGILWNKQVAFESTTRENLQAAIESGLRDSEQSDRFDNFSRYVSWLSSKQLLDACRSDESDYVRSFAVHLAGLCEAM